MFFFIYLFHSNAIITNYIVYNLKSVFLSKTKDLFKSLVTQYVSIQGFDKINTIHSL